MSVWEQLEGCRLKVNAGGRHMERFQDTVEGFLKDDLEIGTIHGQPNSQRTKYLFRVEQTVDLPLRDWGVILGDAIHCYRSALDQLAYTFAKDPSDRTAFPICLTEKSWATIAPSQYWSISPGLVKLIDHVQPYHREDPASHPLAILRTLSNLDKHRGLTPISISTAEMDGEVAVVSGVKSWKSLTLKSGIAFEKGAVVAECRIVPDETDTEPEMAIETEGTFNVTFGEIGAAPSIRGSSVDEVVYEVGEFITVEIIGLIQKIWNESVIAVEGPELHPEYPADEA